MPENIMVYLLVLVAYFIGSISTAIITCKLMKLPDPRSGGSKNPGATNVLRLGGKKAAAITLAGDLLKGLLPVLLTKGLGYSLEIQILVGFAAFIGHLYPLYYRFQGGKGVATAIGVYYGIDIIGGVLVTLIWLFIAKVLKISSLSALIATLLAPLIFYILTGNLAVTIGIGCITILIYWKHRSNIQRLLDGTEKL